MFQIVTLLFSSRKPVPEKNKSSTSNNNWRQEEEMIASDGYYDPNTSHLCLTGSYLQHSLSGRKPSYDVRNASCRSDGTSTPTAADATSKARSISATITKKSSVGQRRVWSSSQDPAVLKEQVLLMLFDSIWPQVINIVGGLVHRYSCHLLASVAALSGVTSREQSSRMSNRGKQLVWYFLLDPFRCLWSTILI